MSVRGNAFVLLNGQLTLWFHKWGAEDLLRRLYAGPAAFLQSLDAWSLVSVPLNDVWSEGAAVVDLDRRRLRWFGAGHVGRQPWTRRVAGTLLQMVWCGWHVVYEVEGQSGLLRRVAALARPVLPSSAEAPEEAPHTPPLVEEPWPHAVDPGSAFVDLLGALDTAGPAGDGRRLGLLLVTSGFAPPRILARELQLKDLEPYVARAVKGERVWAQARS